MAEGTTGVRRLGLATLLSLCSVVCSAQAPARFVRRIRGRATAFNSRQIPTSTPAFPTASRTVEEVVAKAEAFGCDVVAITDHSDRDLNAATPEYFAAIDAARKAHPKLVILAGVEWNFPPWGGDEHATVLVPPAAERRLAEFKERFDDLGRSSHDAALAGDGLRWLAANATVNGVRPVVIHEHPSRTDAHSMENVANFKALRQVSDLVIGFAGAPGHQGTSPIGSYDYKEHVIDRWDPVAARVGDAWDTLLGEGLDVWAADAPSDFHNDSPDALNDFWPGQFSETWLNVPTRDAVGVLQAYRAGAYFADHGRIVRDVALEVMAPGLARAATPGEAIAVAAGTTITAALRFDVPAAAWPAAGPNRIDRVEIITIDTDGARVAAEGPPLAADPAR